MTLLYIGYSYVEISRYYTIIIVIKAVIWNPESHLSLLMSLLMLLLLKHVTQPVTRVTVGVTTLLYQTRVTHGVTQRVTFLCDALALSRVDHVHGVNGLPASTALVLRPPARAIP